MPTLRRILKYTPAVVLGLLVVAWAASHIWRCEFGFERRLGDPIDRAISCENGSVAYWFMNEPEGAAHAAKLTITTNNSPVRFRRLAGRLQWRSHIVRVPLLAIATATFPLAIGPFISFRFRLWHYLAYTTLVAVELAYYLRWQG